MTNTINTSLNQWHDTLKRYIKYNPLNDYHWDSLLKETGGFNKFLTTVAPFAVFLPTKIGQGAHLAFSTIEIVSLKNYPRILMRVCEWVGGYFDPKIGLAVHTTFSLGNHLLGVIKSDRRLEMASYVLSDALTLLSCLKLSKRDTLIVSIMQAIIQSGINFYSSYKVSQTVDKDHKWNAVTSISQALLGAIHLTRAYGLLRDLQKLQNMVGKVFILMRHADRERNGDTSQILETGVTRSQEAAKIIQELKKKYGKQGVNLLASDLIRSEQTAAVIAESLSSKKPEIDARIHERYDSSLMNRKERKLHPQYIEHKSLDSTAQFYHQPVPGYESGFEQYQRMQQGTFDFVAGVKPDYLPIAVSHTVAIKSMMTGLKTEGHAIPDSFLKGTKYCEMLVFQMKPDGNLEGLEKIKVELPMMATL